MKITRRQQEHASDFGRLYLHIEISQSFDWLQNGTDELPQRYLYRNELTSSAAIKIINAVATQKGSVKVAIASGAGIAIDSVCRRLRGRASWKDRIKTA